MGCYINTVYIRHREEGTPYVNHVSPLKNLKAPRPSRRFCEGGANIDDWDSESFQAFLNTLRQPKFETGNDTAQTLRHRLPKDQDGCHKICLWSNEETGQDLRQCVEACDNMWHAKSTDQTRPDVRDLVQPLLDWAKSCRPDLLGATTVFSEPPPEVMQQLNLPPPSTRQQHRPWKTDRSWRSPAKEESQASPPTEMRRTMADVDRQVESPCRLTVGDYRRLNDRLHEGSSADSPLEEGAFKFLNPRQTSPNCEGQDNADKEGYSSANPNSPVTCQSDTATSSHGLSTSRISEGNSEHRDSIEDESFSESEAVSSAHGDQESTYIIGNDTNSASEYSNSPRLAPLFELDPLSPPHGNNMTARVLGFELWKHCDLERNIPRPFMFSGRPSQHASAPLGSGAYIPRDVFKSRLMKQQQIHGDKQTHWHNARALWAGECDVLPPLVRPFRDLSFAKPPFEEGGMPPAEEPSPFGNIGDGRPL